MAHRGVVVGVAYLSWTDTDMVRAADEDEPLRQLRADLPWPANGTAELAPTVERLLAGVARRAPHVYGQWWVRAFQWLPRATVPFVVARRSARPVARLEPLLEGTADQRRSPVGPGGQAAMSDAQA